ncbi:hypothetical protein H6F76_02015 [Leptolyngbya sp. FACHB-321]|uniref:hypothetical protein n=1 Tax=Leptolyngbya sp. FACHB-321 TaxID=2692807 RepID=UPI001688D8B3|nr:hypothetical protein [Leptolyngbya sp. FACHB-321]MBD2033836.1 hypothetical protein [Leptolyngbya sp. FACHB-321]
MKQKVTQWVIPALLLLLPQSAFAQSQFITTPSSLNVAGTREAVESRTLLLQAPQPINGVAIAPSDLSRTDGVGVLPASLIEVKLPQGNKILGNQPLPVSIRFPLNRLNRSGEFSGALLLTYNGGQQIIPVTLRVKDAPWLPLFLLLIGIGLGTGLSLYRTEGKIYDESVVQVGRLRTQMRADT